MKIIVPNIDLIQDAKALSKCKKNKKYSGELVSALAKEVLNLYKGYFDVSVEKENLLSALVNLAENIAAELEKAKKASSQLDRYMKFHPRAMKLLHDGDFFLVVAFYEPYFKEVYGMIRDCELVKGDWTNPDEEKYQEMTK